jgi:hypothetical protein
LADVIWHDAAGSPGGWKELPPFRAPADRGAAEDLDESRLVLVRAWESVRR